MLHSQTKDGSVKKKSCRVEYVVCQSQADGKLEWKRPKD